MRPRCFGGEFTGSSAQPRAQYRRPLHSMWRRFERHRNSKPCLPTQRFFCGSWQSRSLGSHSTFWQKPYAGQGLLRGSPPKANTNPWLMAWTHFETLLGCSLACCLTVGESLKREPSSCPTTTLACWRSCKSTTTFCTQPRTEVSFNLPRKPRRNSRRSWRRCSRRARASGYRGICPRLLRKAHNFCVSTLRFAPSGEI